MEDKLTLKDRVATTKNKSLVVHTRVDARSVADMALFFRAKGEVIESKSQIVRMAFELFHNLLRHQGMIEDAHETTQDALNTLQQIGVRSGVEGRHVGSRLFSQLRLEEYQFEAGHLPPRRKTKSVRDSITEQAKEMAAEMGKEYELIDRSCEKCEELHQVSEHYLSQHGNVCLGCRMKAVEGS